MTTNKPSRPRYSIGRIALVILALQLIGCAGPRAISATKFQEEYARTGTVGTVRQVEYLGQRDGKAYLKIGSLSIFTKKWSSQEYYIDLEALDPEFRKTLPTEGFSLYDRKPDSLPIQSGPARSGD